MKQKELTKRTFSGLTTILDSNRTVNILSRPKEMKESG